ncbi:hypothetical protein CES85_0761 [Ochrobactrum quorumnocens]|jgi:hypothetical protein|uniref:Uncharacterized protein n=1 Tax=Ochrobactrum quorumnocens TaxID=271865 RepID=A0A248UI36_9HYPH|nr:hypothetical protein CES85_0761 [[Ochrobactrum] quorumnocens]
MAIKFTSSPDRQPEPKTGKGKASKKKSANDAEINAELDLDTKGK